MSLPQHRLLSSHSRISSVLNTQYKSFETQYEILHKNAILAAIASEIPWQMLLDLFQLKFYTTDDCINHQNSQLCEMIFILNGSLRVQSIKGVVDQVSPSDWENVIAESIVRVGESVGAYSTMTNTTSPFTILVAHFKTYLLYLSKSKFNSIYKQLTESTQYKVRRLISEAENRLRTTLGYPLVHISAGTKPERSNLLNHAKKKERNIQLCSGDMQNKYAKIEPYSIEKVDKGPGTFSPLSTIKRRFEYEVESSILVLHDTNPQSLDQMNNSSSISRLPYWQTKAKINKNNEIQEIAKVHTKRRLQTIILPNEVKSYALPRSLGQKTRTIKKFPNTGK